MLQTMTLKQNPNTQGREFGFGSQDKDLGECGHLD